MLLNPLDKQAKRDESTQTALRLNTSGFMDYTPFSPIMQDRPHHNPLLVLLNTYKHQAVDAPQTIFNSEHAANL